jgi:hypothetical protein
MSRLVIRGFLAWIIPVVLVACSHVPDARTPPVLTQQPPGNQQSPAEGESPKDNEPLSPNQYDNYGVLFGRVTTGPLPPAGGPGGAAAPGPVPGGSSAHVGVTPAGADHVWWAVTGVHGDYGFLVPAGSYRVTMETRPGMGVAKNLPATIVVRPGERTRFDIHLDSGLR